MSFRTEVKEWFDRVEREMRDLVKEIQDFKKDFAKSENKRDEITKQIQAAQVSEVSSLYNRLIEEDEDEGFVGDVVDMPEKKMKGEG